MKKIKKKNNKKRNWKKDTFTVEVLWASGFSLRLDKSLQHSLGTRCSLYHLPHSPSLRFSLYYHSRLLFLCPFLFLYLFELMEDNWMKINSGGFVNLDTKFRTWSLTSPFFFSISYPLSLAAIPQVTHISRLHTSYSGPKAIQLSSISNRRSPVRHAVLLEKDRVRRGDRESGEFVYLK